MQLFACRPVLLSGLVLSLCVAARPQDNPATIRSSTKEVLLDVVVRNNKQQFVRDLKASDFAVFEDGVKQSVRAFRLVDGREVEPAAAEQAASNSGASNTSAPVNPLRQINLVSIVFHQLGSRGRERAREAALDFLRNELRANTYIAVFSLDYRLNALIPYTNNREAVSKAIQHAATGSSSQFAQDSENLMNQLDRQITGGPGGVNVSNQTDFTAAQSALLGAESSATEGSAMLGKIIHDQLRAFANPAGTHSLESLALFVHDQMQLPGRKTVLYLSEGLLLPPDRDELMRNLISQANRANVSFYAFDVRGLSLNDPMQAGVTGLRQAGRVATAGLENRNLNGAGFNQDEDLQLALHADTQSSLAELAQGTGGFLVANTNEFKKPMQRVMEDVRTHYEIAYQPTADQYDGRFRKVEIKLARSGLHAQTRNGYYAIPDLGREPLAPYEFAALSVLSKAPLPRAFQYHAAAFHFRHTPAGQQIALAIQLPIQNLSILADKKQKVYRIHPSIFAVVKDAKGEVVTKLGQDLPSVAPEKNLEQLKAGSVLYSQPFLLAPGRYTLETVILDRIGERASVKKLVLLVPQPPASARLSSLVPVRSLQSLTTPRNLLDPFQFEGGKLTPELSDTLKSAGMTSLFFVVYPQAGEKPEVALEFSRDGQVVGRTTPQLPEPDATGVIPYIASAKLEPGRYDIRATLKSGGATVETTTSFTIEP